MTQKSEVMWGWISSSLQPGFNHDQDLSHQSQRVPVRTNVTEVRSEARVAPVQSLCQKPKSYRLSPVRHWTSDIHHRSVTQCCCCCLWVGRHKFSACLQALDPMASGTSQDHKSNRFIGSPALQSMNNLQCALGQLQCCNLGFALH